MINSKPWNISQVKILNLETFIIRQLLYCLCAEASSKVLNVHQCVLCAFAEIPWLCMHERNQNLLSILSDLTWLPRGHVCVIHVPELQSEFHEYRATGLQVKMVYTRTGISCPQFVHQFFCRLLMHISGFGESIGPITPLGSIPDQWIYANYVVIQYRCQINHKS